MAIQVVKANVLGFCFGVRRAVELAEKALLENPEKNVYSLGPLIHNQIALKNLCDKGMIIVNEDELLEIYETGMGKIKVRGKVEVEDMKGGKKRLVITEIPYQVNKSDLVKSFGTIKEKMKDELVIHTKPKSNISEDIRTIRDEVNFLPTLAKYRVYIIISDKLIKKH